MEGVNFWRRNANLCDGLCPSTCVLRLGLDGDGMDDDWEMAHFGTLDRDGTGDFDGDGHTDLEEFLAGTDPTNSGSILRAMLLIGQRYYFVVVSP
jgi:hypothetical protein